MKPIDAKSTLVAALIGAILLGAFGVFGGLSFWKSALVGLVVGSGVQIGVRVTGVS